MNDEEGDDTDEAPKTANLSDRLAQRLSAHRTAALQIEVARRPQVALVHSMVQTVLQPDAYGHDLPLGVRLTVKDRLDTYAPDWPESPAAVALRELQQAWGERLPEDSAELFAVLLAMPQDELVQLLAVGRQRGRGDAACRAGRTRRGTGAGGRAGHGRMVEADQFFASLVCWSSGHYSNMCEAVKTRITENGKRPRAKFMA